MKGKRYSTEEKVRILREVDGGKSITESLMLPQMEFQEFATSSRPAIPRSPSALAIPFDPNQTDRLVPVPGGSNPPSGWRLSRWETRT